MSQFDVLGVPPTWLETFCHAVREGFVVRLALAGRAIRCRARGSFSSGHGAIDPRVQPGQALRLYACDGAAGLCSVGIDGL